MYTKVTRLCCSFVAPSQPLLKKRTRFNFFTELLVLRLRHVFVDVGYVTIFSGLRGVS